MARIVMQRESRTKEYELTGEAIMGRKSNCAIKVPSPKCSREHCRIFRGSNGFFIEDMGSSNGTLVNNKKIGSQLLHNNDEIVVGGVTFKFLDKSDDPLVGKRLGKYQIIDKVGVGGMGVVYKATQVTLGREVALKVMSKKLSSQMNFIQSFEREAKIAARLQHHNIIGIHDFGHEDGWYFFSMEFIDGENLLDMALRQGGLSIEECMVFGIQIAQALAHAHEQGILHKDIKPQNIMIDQENNVKLADMGLASIMGGDDEQEFGDSGGVFMATPQYVAPEIIRRQEPDARSDIYSLAATLYHMLTGRPPFKSKSIKDLLKMHLKETPQNPRELRQEAPQALAALILKGLAKNPENRQQNCQELAKELQTALDKCQSSEDAKKLIQSTVAVQRSSTTKARTVVLSKEKLEGISEPANKNKYIIAAVAVVILGALIFLLTSSGEKDAQLLLEQAKELYIQGADDSAREKLELIIDEYHNTNAASDARRMLEQYSGSKAQQELHRIKNAITHGRISNKDAAQQLKLFLRQGMVSKKDLSDIKEYIISLGEDPDIRSPWEVMVDNLIESKGYNAARLYLMRLPTIEKQDESQLAQIRRRLDEINSTIINKSQQLFTQAKADKEARLLSSSYSKLQNICRLYPSSGKWFNQAAKGVARMNTISIKRYLFALNKLVGAIKSGNPDLVREAGFRMGEHLSNLPIERYGKQFPLMQKAYEDFFALFLKNAEPKTKSALDNIILEVEGKSRKFTLKSENEKIIAVATDDPAIKKELSIFELNADDVARIVPLSQVRESQALGAALFFYAANKKKLLNEYAAMIPRTGNPLSNSALDVKLLADGIAPLAYLSLLSQSPTHATGSRINTENVAVLKKDSEYASPICFLRTDNACVKFNTSSGGTLKITTNAQPLLFLNHVGGKGVLTTSKDSRRFDWPEDGVKITFTEYNKVRLLDMSNNEITKPLLLELSIPTPVQFILESENGASVTRFDLGMLKEMIRDTQQNQAAG